MRQLLLFLIITICVKGQSEKDIFTMFYNVENLFDTINDPMKSDNEFLPGSAKKWNSEKYNQKIDSVFIGDSYTQGACVEKNSVISSYFKDFNSINLGLDGNNPYIYANLSKIFIPRIKPKYVIQIFHANDNTELGKIFLKNMDNFGEVNEEYGKYFENIIPPARETVEVSKLPLDVNVEISCIAIKK